MNKTLSENRVLADKEKRSSLDKLYAKLLEQINPCVDKTAGSKDEQEQRQKDFESAIGEHKAQVSDLFNLLVNDQTKKIAEQA